MKIFTYLRTLWHEFWMWSIVGPASVDSAELMLVPEQPEMTIPEYLLPPKKNTLQANCKVIFPKSKELQDIEDALNGACGLKPVLAFRETPQPTKKLWVYNVSRVEHHLDHPMMGQVTIPANDTKKRYKLWTSFPDKTISTHCNLEAQVIDLAPMSGEYFVNDLINPDSRFKDAWGKQLLRTSIGADLSIRGVFWSYNNPPTIKEVNAAVKPMRALYADLLERMEISYNASIINEETILRYRKDNHGASLEEALTETRKRRVLPEITPEHHAAAEYFKVTTPWHPVIRG